MENLRNFSLKMLLSTSVSYYDYYQPEAYVPSSDTYIEKDSSVNDELTNFVTQRLQPFWSVMMLSS